MSVTDSKVYRMDSLNITLLPLFYSLPKLESDSWDTSYRPPVKVSSVVSLEKTGATTARSIWNESRTNQCHQTHRETSTGQTPPSSQTLEIRQVSPLCLPPPKSPKTGSEGQNDQNSTILWLVDLPPMAAILWSCLVPVLKSILKIGRGVIMEEPMLSIFLHIMTIPKGLVLWPMLFNVFAHYL